MLSVLLESFGHQAHPVFFQFVTHTVFKVLIRIEYPIAASATALGKNPHSLVPRPRSQSRVAWG